MRINPILENSLKTSALGRAKLKMLYRISGREGFKPTKKQIIEFIESFSDEQFTAAEFYTSLLTLGSCRIATLKGKSNFANLNSALKKLDQYPVETPVFYQFKSKFHDKELCAFIKGEKLRDVEGYVYTVLIFNDERIPESIWSALEIRSSQSAPEPAFTINLGGSFEVYAKTDPAIFDNPSISICVDLLIDLANNHMNTVVPMSQVSQPGFKSKQMAGTSGPADKKLMNLLRKVRQKEAQCYLAEIRLNQIIPHSYEHCFRIPLYLIDHAQEVIARSGFTMLVYQEEGRYIMSDCYPAYLAFRRMRYSMVQVIVIAIGPPKDIKIIRRGGTELIPPIMAMSSGGYDQLDLNMKDALLERYLRKLSVLETNDDIINAQCVILTEDTDIQMLECLLHASEFNIDETLILSYKNCTNLDSLDISVKMIKNVNPYTTVIIHRDRDYMVESEVNKVISRIEAANAIAFITEGTDIESYFINANHISELYPSLSRSIIDACIENATKDTSSLSIELIKKHEHGDRHKAKASYLDEFIPGIYESNKARFRHGKKTLGILKSLLQKEAKSNIDLARPTTPLKDPKLNRVALTIWKF